jgi:hypothetical protein
MLMLMLICYERKIPLNGWLILADKLKRTGRKMEPTVNSGEAHIADDSSVRTRYAL